MAVLADVVDLGSELERSYPVRVRGRLKFRVGQLVYVAFSLDETVMEFAHPKLERDALIATAPQTYSLPAPSDMRFHWMHAVLARLEPTRRASSSSTRGAWWCRRSSCAPTTSPTRPVRGAIDGIPLSRDRACRGCRPARRAAAAPPRPP
ncbi:hypothetical protein ABA31_20370 [Agrococcus baldri]|uniref:Uncharacterized protein n=1 Tax=Agrococcus baldri TaxID=153730 RepID=A0AA87US62_9MICO|nr:hypothetical protein ABA31_20370 [Agrococcus baldri]